MVWKKVLWMVVSKAKLLAAPTDMQKVE
jgi:hypothetical protein